MKNDGRFKKGFRPWNKGVTGYMGANKTSFKKGDISQRQLAKDVGISQAVLCDVINFKRWK